MVKASKGIMEKTRQKFRRGPRQRGLSPITRSFQTFDVGAKVTIVIDTSVQKGWPHHRFHGMTGTVVERCGAAFVVDVRFGGRIKKAIVRPEHRSGAEDVAHASALRLAFRTKRDSGKRQVRPGRAEAG